MPKPEKMPKGFHVPADQKRIKKEVAHERMKQWKANPKANPTNREVMEAIADLYELIDQRT